MGYNDNGITTDKGGIFVVIGHFLEKSNRVLLDTIKREILKSLKIKGLDSKRVSIHLKDENNCLKVSVCLI